MKSIVLILLLSVMANAKTELQLPVKTHVFPNGLTLVVHEDHGLPQISYHQWFRVGSLNEKVGRTGLAHFFEHLLFRGTKKYPSDMVEGMLQRNGALNNAFTSHEFTGYYINIASNKLELIADFESDRMRNLVFSKAIIDAEREVVKEERRMRLENSVSGSLREKLYEEAYKTHPLRWPVVGYMKDLNATAEADFKAFYDQYYVPNNSVIVIVGDVKFSKAKDIVAKYYGSIPSRPLPLLELPDEKPLGRPREFTVEKDVSAMTTFVHLPGAKLGEKDDAALDLIVEILTGGFSSRLYQKMVYKNPIASYVSMGNNARNSLGDILFSIGFNPGVSASKGLSLVQQEMDRLKNEKVSDIELQTAKNKRRLGFLESFETLDEKAQNIAFYMTVFGSIDPIYKQLGNWESITVDDIQMAARKYLNYSMRTVVTAIPKSSEKKQLNDAPAAAAGGQ
jgi:zinc protease